jgi:hypothetical protein
MSREEAPRGGHHVPSSTTNQPTERAKRATGREADEAWLSLRMAAGG